MMSEVPDPIKIAVAQLSNLSNVILECLPELISEKSSWAVRFRLISAFYSDFVPKETRWVALIDDLYPTGEIRLFPAQRGGLVHTFPHQDRNVIAGSNSIDWRTGKPCLDSTAKSLGRIAGDPEPKDDAEQRLRWHIERCLAWLEVAAKDQLMVKDEPFEIPQCPSERLDASFTLIHDEGSDTWPVWDKQLGNFGEVHVKSLPNFEKVIVADDFFDIQGKQIRSCRRRSQPSEPPLVGYWWLWPSPIVIPPWYTPETWVELRRIGATLKVNVDRFIQWIAQQSARKDPVVLLLGYPIPELWHGAPTEIHWQAILPPQIPSKIMPVKGFRANQQGRREQLRREIFSGEKKLTYLKTTNWHPDRLQARGRFPLEVRKRSIAVIGAGALGSTVSELLARGGIADILIIDHDSLEAGNLVRHILSGTDLGRNKAISVAARLQNFAPMSRISSHEKRLPSGDDLQKLMDPFDIVMDCTGNDDVLRRISAAWWSIPRHFISASLGFAAKHMFLFRAHACSFPFEKFDGAIRPWLVAERSQWSEAEETLEGAGCWSPLFPARNDDVWLAAIVAVKYLERVLGGNVSEGLQVLEKRSDDYITGYQSIELNHMNIVDYNFD